MSQQLRVLVGNSTDPYFNLATEDWIFRDMDPETKVLFLWRNDKSIIVGRGQNVWSECDLDGVERDGVHVVRRHSGGGAVYQDLGNTCFTFMGKKEAGKSTKELYARNNGILIRALASLGIEAQSSGRNDLVVDNDGQSFKISGSAFKESKDRCFHHGTMLMNVDLTKLSNYLTPDSKKLKAKGIKSVRSRVLNLKDLRPDIDHEIFCQTLIEQFFVEYEGSCPIERLDNDKLTELETLAEYYETLKSWDWVYGKTPNFQHTLSERFSWEGIELHLDTDKGHIRAAKLYTDSLVPDPLENLVSFLKDKPYTKSGLETACREHLQLDSDHEDMLKEVYRWVSQAI